MKKLVLTLTLLFHLLVAFAQNSFNIQDFQLNDKDETKTYVLKPEHDINEFTLELDVTVVSDKGSLSLAWNFCDLGDCNIFHCYSNAFFDLIGNSSMVFIMKKEVKVRLAVKVVSDHSLFFQLYLDDQLKSEGYKVIERNFSRKLYLNLTVNGEGLKINAPSREYDS
jgi:hypothetical protein